MSLAHELHSWDEIKMAYTDYRSTYGPRLLPFTLFIVAALAIGWLLYSRHARGSDDVQSDAPTEQTNQQ